MIISKIVKINNNNSPSTKYIEGELLALGIKPLRWAIVNIDDEYYYVHQGQIDIFNFSTKPEGKSIIIKDNFKRAFEFRATNSDLVSKGTFNQLNCNNDKVFAYSRSYKDETIIVIGNLDHKHVQKKVIVKANGVKKEKNIQVIQGMPNLRTKNNRIYTDLAAGEIKVLRLTDFSL